MKKKILIIEDNKELIEIYKMRFENAGFEIHTCHNGLDAMLALTTEAPDLMILDLMMPDMNGYEVLESIKNNLSEENKKIPIVVWSNLSQKSDKQKALDLGADLYLLKSSFSGDDLVKTIQNFLDKRS